MRCGALANAAAVFVEAQVAHIVHAVFDTPMVAVERQQARRAGLLRSQAGEAIPGFGAEFAGDEVRGLAPDDEDLRGVGKIEVADPFGGGPDAPPFETTVALIEGFVRRGETLPSAGPRCLA